jgi:hypothetical protein
MCDVVVTLPRHGGHSPVVAQPWFTAIGIVDLIY